MAIESNKTEQSSIGASRAVSLEELATEIQCRAKGKRLIVAIAGPAGSGKSTIAAALQIELLERHKLRSQIVPMDGFHYDNAVLEQRGLADKKGAPETFDIGGLEATLKRLTESDRIEDVAVPVFDRNIDLSRAGAQIVDRETKVLLVEGNYLMMEKGQWSRLSQYFDLSVMIKCDEPTLRARLMKRWLDLGLTEEKATKKVETNDLPNGRRVIEESSAADFDLLWTLS